MDLVVKGFKDGLPRGWFFNRTNGLFQSDRQAETLSPTALRQLATVGNEFTYTAVPRDSGKRIGIDRDDDGYFDRDELDFGSDPANSLSLATNRPPTLSVISNRTVFAGQTLEFSVTATDPDIPLQALTFAINTDAPPGATINSTNGLLTWTTSSVQSPGTNTITVTVTDSGSPNRSDAKSFSVVLLELLVGALTVASDGVTLSWTAIPNQSYRLQYKHDLNEPAWTDLSSSVTATNGVVSVTDPAVNRQRFYRLLLIE